MEKYDVIEDKVVYPREEVKEALMIPADHVLEILRQHPEVQSKFKEYISADIFAKLGDIQFRDSEEYASLIANIDSIGQTNLDTLETLGSEIIYKDFSGNLKKYLDENEIKASVENLEESVKRTHILPLDIYRYEALKLKYGLSVGSGAKAFYIPTFDCVVVNLHGTEFGGGKLDPDTLFMLHCEIINGVLSHELLHSVAYQNLWSITDVEKSNNTVADRRSGISAKRPDGNEKLVQLNEAITQKIALDILAPVFTYPPAQFKNDLAKFSRREFSEKTYKNEREVLDYLLKKIDWRLFLKAYFEKHELLDLGREIEKQFGVTLKEISESMKKEISMDSVTTYPETKKLLSNQ